MRLHQIVWNGPRPAMDHKNGIVAQESLRKKLVSVTPLNRRGTYAPRRLGTGVHARPINYIVLIRKNHVGDSRPRVFCRATLATCVDARLHMVIFLQGMLVIRRA